MFSKLATTVLVALVGLQTVAGYTCPVGRNLYCCTLGLVITGVVEVNCTPYSPATSNCGGGFVQCCVYDDAIHLGWGCSAPET